MNEIFSELNELKKSRSQTKNNVLNISANEHYELISGSVDFDRALSRF